MAVLGLIAGLTVPSIINSVQQVKKRAVFKEDFQVLSQIINEGVLNGDFDSLESWDYIRRNDVKSFSGYMTSKLIGAKQCITGDSTSYGCVANDPTSAWLGNTEANNNNARWVIANGSKIKIYNNDYLYSVYPTLLFTFLADATQTNTDLTSTSPNVIFVLCNISQDIANIGGLLIKPGTCGPREAGYWADQFYTIFK